MDKYESDIEMFADRMLALDLRHPRLDRLAAEGAMRQHLDALDLPHLAVHWIDSAEAYDYAFSGLDRTDYIEERELLRQVRRPIDPGADDLISQGARDLLRLFVRVPACDAMYSAASHVFEEAHSKNIHGGQSGLLRTELSGLAYRRRELTQVAIFEAAEYATCLRDDEQVSLSEKLDRIWKPLVDAVEAGLFVHRYTKEAIICAPRPAIFFEINPRGQFHRADGPAIMHPSGRVSAWYWHGTRVPEWVIARPHEIDFTHIAKEKSEAVRLAMIQRMGAQRAVAELGARAVTRDECGVLLDFGDRRLFVVEVANGTIESDGSRRYHYLFVPASMRSAREAVAWTYGLRGDEYDVVART